MFGGSGKPWVVALGFRNDLGRPGKMFSGSEMLWEGLAHCFSGSGAPWEAVLGLWDALRRPAGLIWSSRSRGHSEMVLGFRDALKRPGKLFSGSGKPWEAVLRLWNAMGRCGRPGKPGGSGTPWDALGSGFNASGSTNRIPGKTHGIPAPGTPIPESVGKSGNRALGSVVFLRSLRSPRAQISDSVGSSGERPRPRPRIFTEIRYPTPRFPGGGSGFEIRPSLSPARDATFVPEMPYFTVPFLAGSHRSRAGAAQVAKSSIVLPKIKGGGWRP